MKILAVVTAKSTSKRVRGKNKKLLAGKPLYKWTTDFLMENEAYFEDIVFSTDSPRAFDVKPIHVMKRPKPLCEDKMPHVMSVRHALLHMEKKFNKIYDYAVLFQPTNPLRDWRDLGMFVKMMEEYQYMLGNTYYLDDNLSPGYIEQALKWGDGAETEGVVVRSGSMYAYSRKYLVVTDINKIDLDRFYVMIPKHRGYNINNKEDFAVVEAFIKEHGCLPKT